MPDDQWLDRDAGPVVRPYALTGGRTRASGEKVDLLSIVRAAGGAPADPSGLEPEYRRVLVICQQPTSVADLAVDVDLPLGVVRILLADMRDRGLISIRQPTAGRLTDPKILKEVADGLRRLLSDPPERGHPDHYQDAGGGWLRRR
jgi:Protein of unknown function (DUF742)